MSIIGNAILLGGGGGSVTVESLSVTQNGTYTAPTGKAYSPVTVSVSGGGVTPVEENDVNFIDYDGTILHSYTAAEFANLSALPANPTHTGLTAQGWNWTLSNAKTYVASNGKLWIGQMYITASGDTEIDIVLDDAGLLSPYLKVSVNGTVTVDWGDGSTADTITGTSLTTSKYQAHTYSATGKHTIKIHVASGSFTFYNNYILTNTNSTSNASRRYNSSIIAVRLGSGVSIGNNAFNNCYSLQSVTIPSSVTSMGTSAFANCYSLQSVTISDHITSIGNSAFYNCYSLQSVNIPTSVTSIQTSAFYGCYSLRSVTIPNSVTSMGSYAFYTCPSLQSVNIPTSVTSVQSSAFANCSSLHKLIFKPTSPPTVTNSSTWTGLPTDCIIYVPSGKKSAYTSANNYPSSSTYTYVEE